MNPLKAIARYIWGDNINPVRAPLADTIPPSWLANAKAEEARIDAAARDYMDPKPCKDDGVATLAALASSRTKPVPAKVARKKNPPVFATGDFTGNDLLKLM